MSRGITSPLLGGWLLMRNKKKNTEESYGEETGNVLTERTCKTPRESMFFKCDNINKESKCISLQALAIN